jgi:hypothetical protein
MRPKYATARKKAKSRGGFHSGGKTLANHRGDLSVPEIRVRSKAARAVLQGERAAARVVAIELDHFPKISLGPVDLGFKLTSSTNGS